MNRQTPRVIERGTEARKALLRGVEKLATPVEVTIGTKGSNVLIDSDYHAPLAT